MQKLDLGERVDVSSGRKLKVRIRGHPKKVHSGVCHSCAGLPQSVYLIGPEAARVKDMALKRAFQKGILEAGCDEAGRGCLAGPVFAAAVIMPVRYRLPLLNDSKQLSPAVRAALRSLIEKKAIAWAVAMVDHEEIDRINILWASVKAMHLAVDALQQRPELLLIDGNKFRAYPQILHQCIVGGDGLYASIAAASILAKTHRDEYMQRLHAGHPQYGWDVNKGYGTRAHRAGIRAHGLSPHHRKTFNMGPYEAPELFTTPDISAQSAALL